MRRVFVAASLWFLVCGCRMPQTSSVHIVGKIVECNRYVGMNPHFPKAFSFLKRTDLADLKPGRYEIDGDNCWAMVQEVKLTPLAGAKVEAHRKYIDIQSPITGSETIGLLTLSTAQQSLPFNDKDDYVLFKAETNPVTLQPGEFAIFIPPTGGHAPGHAAEGGQMIRKLVIKVKCE